MFLQAIWDRINPPTVTSPQQDKAASAALIKLYKSSPVRSKWRKGDEDGGLGNYNANEEDDEIIAHEEEEGDDFADGFKLSENLTTEDDQDGDVACYECLCPNFGPSLGGCGVLQLERGYLRSVRGGLQRGGPW